MEDKIGVSKQEKSKSQPQQDVKESEIGDKREVRDIYSGRVVNKPMRPAPVLAPIKRKALSEQEGTFQKMMKTQETMTDEFKVENSKEKVDCSVIQECESDDNEEIDEIQIVMRPGRKKRLSLKIPGVGKISINLKMEKEKC